METLGLLTFCSLISLSTFLDFSIAADTMSPVQSISGIQTIVSSGQNFELGFFSPGNSKKRYLGIWYKNTPGTIVWVANRNNPVTDSYGVFTISNNGTLVILNQTNSVIWSSNSKAAQSPVAQLLDSGNLVLKDSATMSSESYLWQSFDYPFNTWLPGMKMGRDLNNDLDRYLTSCRNSDDASSGEFTYKFDHRVLPQIVLEMGSIKKFRTGPWNGLRFSGIPQTLGPYYSPILAHNMDLVGFMYELHDQFLNTRSRTTLNESGVVQHCVSKNGSTEWAIMYTRPTDLCDNYGQCGANGICRIYKSVICECLKGYVPKSQEEWELLNWANGCVRRVPLDCQSGEGFIKLSGVKFPDLLEVWLDKSMSTKECEAECLKNCSCTAYANSDITGGGNGCLMWFGDLIDIRGYAEETPEQHIFVRMPASELESIHYSNMKKRLVFILVVSIIPAVLTLGLVFWYIIWKKRTNRRGLQSKKEDVEVPLFDLATVATATNNFSQENMLGAGGFGPVYKGLLCTGQDIAVKRMSKSSRQGLEEFKNEVVLISKLQHRNLVRLLGYCIQEEEGILLYEYMPNKSLDYFLFDQNRSALLAWPKRFDIVMGIVRGILYLHQDSRLQIIHRDLKAGNILLDINLNPKISDFGLARAFTGDEVEVNTNRVVGTYGYMSPEYAVDGTFSVKSDVFSLGVLLLEIVSGQKNRGFYHPDHHHNLLGHAWLLWNEDRALEIMDTCLEDSHYRPQVLRFIQVGLLCVQKFPEDRPAMSSVVFMLANEEAILPQPKQPGFFIERSSSKVDNTSKEEEQYTENNVTITTLEAR